MHGRKRETPEQTAERKAAAAPKAALYAKLQAGVLARRAAAQYDAESLDLCARLLELNPEVLTAWNFRRDTLEALRKQDASSEREYQLLNDELQLTERALRRNPKSYGTWHHRRWSVSQLGAQADTVRELALCAQLLAADERNFHCWNYRRYIAYLAGTPAADEAAFARAKIDANFSNYSAWHHRSTVLRKAQAEAAPSEATAPAVDTILARCSGPLCAPAPAGDALGPPLSADVLSSEFELVTQAFYTEPEDQAAWFYHDWLLGQALECAAHVSASDLTWPVARELLVKQADTCRQLCELEPTCRWPPLTLVRILRAITEGEAACGDGGDDTALMREARELLTALAARDTMRRGFYTDLLAELTEPNA